MKLILSHKILWILIASLSVGFVYPGSASAAEKKDKAARRAAQMVQKAKQEMEQEKANMQAQFDLQKKELEDKVKSNDEQLQKRSASLGAAQRKLGNLESELVKTNTEKTALETKLLETQTLLESTQRNLADLTLQHKQAQVDLKVNDNQRKTLSTNLANTNLSLNTCEQKNTKLHQFSSDLIKIYDKPSTYTAVMREEPFFQLKRVELENILQNHQDKLDDEKVVSRKSAY
jgi:chromosome segregation ATPase